MRNRRTVTRLAVAAVLLTANWTAYVWAVTNDRIIETALGYFMAPLGTMILGVTVLHEHASRLQKLAIGLAALAVVVLTMSYGRPPVVALVIAATWSTYGLLKRQVPLSPIESLAGETFLLTIPAGVLVVAMAGSSDSIPSTATGGEWVLILLTGVVTAVPLLLFAVAARRVPFTLLGALQYLVPTINFLLGWLVYDEPLPLERLVGFALVWAALIAVAVDQVSSRAPSRRRAPSQPDGRQLASARCAPDRSRSPRSPQRPSRSAPAVATPVPATSPTRRRTTSRVNSPTTPRSVD